MNKFTLKLASMVIAAVYLAPAAYPDTDDAGSRSSGDRVSLQVLGSGGPIADDARASSSYLVWRAGKSRFLVDVGGGAFLCFAEAGASFTDLDLIAISHFHTDHAADLPALLKLDAWC